MKKITKWLIFKIFNVESKVDNKLKFIDLYKEVRKKKYKKINVLDCIQQDVAITTKGGVDNSKDMKQCISTNNIFRESEYDGSKFAKGQRYE